MIVILILPEVAAAKTYSVLAVRVDFLYEEPDHDTTSGQGQFDLRNYYEDATAQEDYRNPWDVPPHDRQYFDNHLTALHNYWSTVSEGRVEIDYDVWPRENDAAYTLSKKFYKYGNGRSKEETYEKLVELLEESMLTCKNAEGSNIDFSDYDTFIVIHAGIGSETSGMLNDIPSAFISSDDISTYLDTPLVIDGIAIDNGLVIPETTSGNGFGGLNGIIAQMFGYSLGLPSMSNNEDGLPGAGGWCLMDTGSMAFGYSTRGFVPTHPTAWSKIELGWIKPLVATTDITIDIVATHIDNGGVRAVKVPITDDEYLLLENRQRYASRDSMATAIFSDSDTSGVWLAADHYDSYIPGSGILIWRINEAIIRDKRAANEINDDMYRRGIDLLEADGRQDIGAWIGFGDPRGEYTEGHDDDTFRTGSVTTLGPNTEPNSGSIWGGNSGITITVNSENADTMNVTISFGNRLPGFPVQLSEAGNVTAADADGDGKDELIVFDFYENYGKDMPMLISSDAKRIDFIASDYHPSVIYNSFGNKTEFFSGRGNTLDIYYFNNLITQSKSLSTGDSFSGYYSIIRYNPVTTYLNNRPVNVVYIPSIFETGNTRSSKLDIYDPSKTTGIILKSISFPDTLQVQDMSVSDSEISVLSKRGVLYSGTLADTEMTRSTFENDLAQNVLNTDLDRDGVYESIVLADNYLYIINPDDTETHITIPATPVASPAAADIDSDGYPEVIISTERGIYAYKYGGVPVDGFPYMLPPGDSDETITTSPIIADMDGDGSLDIGVATSDMRFVAFDTDGIQANGFPIAIAGRVENTPCLFRHNTDGTLGLAYITTDGLLNVHDLDSLADDHLMPWPMWKGGADLANSLTNDEIFTKPITTASFDAYCYPNPITGASGTFRFTPESATDCHITVFTVDGSKIYDVHVPESDVLPGVPNEITMNTNTLASGLYIAKIQTRRNSVLYKFGVMK